MEAQRNTGEGANGEQGHPVANQEKVIEVTNGETSTVGAEQKKSTQEAASSAPEHVTPSGSVVSSTTPKPTLSPRTEQIKADIFRGMKALEDQINLIFQKEVVTWIRGFLEEKEKNEKSNELNACLVRQLEAEEQKKRQMAQLLINLTKEHQEKMRAEEAKVSRLARENAYLLKSLEASQEKQITNTIRQLVNDELEKAKAKLFDELNKTLAEPQGACALPGPGNQDAVAQFNYEMNMLAQKEMGNMMGEASAYDYAGQWAPNVEVDKQDEGLHGHGGQIGGGARAQDGSEVGSKNQEPVKRGGGLTRSKTSNNLNLFFD